MFVAVDVDYLEDRATAAAVLFSDWRAAKPDVEYTSAVSDIQPYIPGQFWQRELPCIHAVLGELDAEPRVIVVDGYVWLDNQGRKGLGAYLYDALEGRVAVVGVAKTSFRGSSHAAAVCRGQSKQPLYVTAAGMAIDQASGAIASMHGRYRMPTLLKRVDTICRGG